MSEFRVYAPEECGKDGYPFAWHGKQLVDDLEIGLMTLRGGVPAIKDLVREQAGNRCVRCGHPYKKGMGEWSPCDEHCRHHAGGTRRTHEFTEAQWRILTVHHLNGDKADCRWWNLASLCQRCHLRIQRTVVMPRVFPWEHSEWFKAYAAGWYAHSYLGEDLTREETMARLDELLSLERVA